MKFIHWIEYIFVFIELLIWASYHFIRKYCFAHQQTHDKLTDKQAPIAIIGGGIAGVSAAYALVRSGYRHVTIFEASSTIAGNARTHRWHQQHSTITTGLSVLAWPKFFHNYTQLLNELKIPTTTVQLPFFIHHREKNRIFAHGQQHYLEFGVSDRLFDKDLQRWTTMVNKVCSIQQFFHGQDRSLYHLSIWNPFNYIPLRLLTLIFGISNQFWHEIIVPMYASSFLSTNISFVPASILPIINDIIPLQPNQIPTLETWMHTSIDVFDRMTRDIIVRTNHRVERVHCKFDSNLSPLFTIDDDPILYERIIFACHAPTIFQMFNRGQTRIHRFLRLLLTSVTYADDHTDPNLLDGIIHRDHTILPEAYRHVLQQYYANYIDVYHDHRTKDTHLHNTFILSSWLPNVHSMLNNHHLTHTDIEPMLVTYACRDKPQPLIRSSKIVGHVNNRNAHPNLSFRNQFITLLIRFVQGHRGMYFCGSAFTPANGHELSLLSGFAVAELIGASYPFKDHIQSFNDYIRYKRMCVD